MRHWINIAPVAVFFAAYYIGGNFQIATAAIMAAVVVQIALLRLFYPPVKIIEWSTLALILAFGAITLLLKDSFYLQLKTTVINFLFATALLVADFAFGKNLAKALLGTMIDAPPILWRRVSIMLASVFFAIGILNLMVIFNFNVETWIWVKTFIYPAINFIALIAIIAYLMRGGAIKNEKQS
ncbi:MAG: inner membrane-spanning protein YciB [Gammaproteobacteria bacterium WSBS_2016_MAG_OTU1]